MKTRTAHFHGVAITTPRGRSRRQMLTDAGFGPRTVSIIKHTFTAFFVDNVSRLGAALAFYTTVAVAPLMVLAVSVAGIFFEESRARETVLHEIRQMVGSQAAASAIESVQNPLAKTEGQFATVIGVITLLLGALGVFQHLQDALNSIWHTRPPVTKGFWDMVRRRLFSMAIVLATGFLLLVSLIFSAGLSWFGTHMLGRYDLPVLSLELVNLVLSLIAVTLLFALLFKLLPDVHVPWRHVWLGAFVTAVLFNAGKTVLSFYLAHAKLASVYGAAASIIALLIWCYYAAQIVFLGAEFTRVTSLSDAGRDFAPLEAPEQQVRTSR